MKTTVIPYEFFTDSGANLNDTQIEELGLNMISMNYIMGGQIYPSYVKGDPGALKRFYALLREGKVITTTSLNIEEYISAFTPTLEAGKDILYLSFSSAMSSNYNNSIKAAEALAESFPDRRIHIIDSLSGCSGQGLLAYYGATLRLDGLDMDEVIFWLESNKLNIAHWFTVDDLGFLFRGGRVSRGAYLIGSFAQIKPLMHLTDGGFMAPVAKVIGRKRSIQKIAERIAETIVHPEEQVIFINHADCEDDANYLLERLQAKLGVKKYVINMLDPVMGSHAGPGSLAAFCLATTR